MKTIVILGSLLLCSAPALAAAPATDNAASGDPNLRIDERVQGAH